MVTLLYGWCGWFIIGFDSSLETLYSQAVYELIIALIGEKAMIQCAAAGLPIR